MIIKSLDAVRRSSPHACGPEHWASRGCCACASSRSLPRGEVSRRLVSTKAVRTALRTHTRIVSTRICWSSCAS